MVLVAAQGSSFVEVGRVTVVYWGDDARAAMRLGEAADNAGPFPGLPEPRERPVRVLLAHDRAQFDSLTRSRLPEWGVGAAFPGSRTIVLNLTRDDPVRALRHEMAHLALHDAVRRVPRWFDEGYATVAAGEWDRVEVLRLNVALLRGNVPSLAALDDALRRGDAAQADVAYALATTAVLTLQRLGGDRGLAPLIANLGTTADFDRAMRTTYQMTLGQFETRWQREVRQRYGWVLFGTSFAVFWGVVGSGLVVLFWWRRRHDRDRRLALDEGWQVPPEYEDTELDHPGTSR